MKYIVFTFFVFLTGCSTKSPNATILIGTIDEKINDTLFVTDFIPTPASFDTIVVTDGNFRHQFSTPIQDVRRVFNKYGRYQFDFVTQPGEVHVNFTNDDFTIDGKLNNELKLKKEILNAYVNELQEIFKLQMAASSPKDSVDASAKKKALNDEIKSKLLSINQNNQDNILAAVSAWASIIIFPDETKFYDELYDNIDASFIDQTTLGALLKKHRTRRTLPTDIPHAILYDETFYEVEFSDILSQYTFVDFWASWCAPCRKEIPKLKEVYNKFESNDNLKIVSVSTDSDMEKWTAARLAEEMPWDQYIVKDRKNDEVLSQHWGKVSIPFGILIGPDKTTIANGIRTAAELDSILIELGI